MSNWARRTVVSAAWIFGFGLVALGQAQPASPPVATSSRPAGAMSQPVRLPPGVQFLRDVTYARAGDKPLLLDLFVPEKAEGKLPLVVWVHGGAWLAGNKDRCPAAFLAGRGYVVASINYRLSQEALFPAQIEDCKAAIRFLRANADKFHIDPDRVGAWGASAGGHLVALLGTAGGVKELEGNLGNADQSSKVQAVVDFFGPTDFMKILDQPSNLKHGAPDSPEARLIGGLVKENADKVAKANPIAYITKDCPPFLIVHGDKDMTVPLNQSQLLYDALKQAGVDATFQVIAGAGHGFTTRGPTDMAVEFLDKHLKKPS